jgi:hypothetical protein
MIDATRLAYLDNHQLIAQEAHAYNVLARTPDRDSHLYDRRQADWQTLYNEVKRRGLSPRSEF